MKELFNSKKGKFLDIIPKTESKYRQVQSKLKDKLVIKVKVTYKKKVTCPSCKVKFYTLRSNVLFCNKCASGKGKREVKYDEETHDMVYVKPD